MPKLTIALAIIIGLMASESMAHDGRGGFGPRAGNTGGQQRSDFGVHGFGGARGESGSHGFGVIGAPSGANAPTPNFREWHGGESHFEGHHHHYSPGVIVESPSYVQPNLYWPNYTVQPYYSAPPVIIQSAPPVYIEQQILPSPQTFQPDSWSYCPDPAGYYPHVQDCPGGWMQIPPQPAGQPPGYWYYCSDPAGYYPYVRQCGTVWQNVVP